jgi:putative membrane protein
VTVGADETDAVVEATSPVTDDGTPWLRLDHRMIWVDLARSALSVAPSLLAILLLGTDASWANLWPLLTIAAFGVLGAVRDALRWAFTRYRVTDDHLERRTGLVVRRYRSVRRDRIRSVDTTARLRHRLAGLRVVLVGAGQQLAAGESALALDAVSRRDAEALRAALLSSAPAAPDGGPVGPARDDDAPAPTGEQVLARFRPWWVVYNMASVWSFVTAAGLLWGAYWLLTGFGLDPAGWVVAALPWDTLGRVGTVTVGLGLTFVVGAVGMGLSFLATSWGFELARVPGPEGTQLRTRQGLLTTREVTRDDRRLRGVTVAEPVLWRWMGMADTQVITTGLSVWSPSQPSSVLPRGPRSVAWPVARAVLGADPDPVGAPLARHPAGALRRRLWWATATTAGVVGVLGWLASAGALPAAAPWWGLTLWPVALLAGLVAYRALGHAIVGDHLVVRSGLTSRSTSVLRRDAVSTIALRESVLQRRLGLRTVSAMTAAGWGAYQAPDLARDEALRFAVAAAPGLLNPFLVPADDARDAPGG